ncbi:hypothetical protein Pfo_013647 [Paulownia fortunei]|nr:hypothetical protein Pfo_013647 [Paulownia fortunei]
MENSDFTVIFSIRHLKQNINTVKSLYSIMTHRQWIMKTFMMSKDIFLLHFHLLKASSNVMKIMERQISGLISRCYTNSMLMYKVQILRVSELWTGLEMENISQVQDGIEVKQ